MAEKETFEPKVLQISDLEKLMANSPEVTMDLEQDAWEYGAPPPKNAYKVKWLMDKDGLKQYQHSADPRDISLSISIVGEIKSDDPNSDKVPVYSNLSTRIYRGKKISTMAGFYVKLATWYKIPPLSNPINDAKLAGFVVKLLKAEPVVLTELDWKGSYKYQDKNGKDLYENVYNKYEDFPVDKKDGSRIHIVSVPVKNGGGSIAEVRAMLKVNRFFGKTDAVPNYNAMAQGLVSAPRQVAPIKVEEPTLVVENVSVTPKLVSPQQVAAPQQTQMQESDEMDLSLLEA